MNTGGRQINSDKIQSLYRNNIQKHTMQRILSKYKLLELFNSYMQSKQFFTFEKSINFEVPTTRRLRKTFQSNSCLCIHRNSIYSK